MNSSAASLFSGIGGIDVGLQQAGHHTVLLCEIDESARAVLRTRFPDVPLHDDIRTLGELPRVDVLTAGFPCQDLSQAGQTAGIQGRQSGLVEEVFRLLEGSRDAIRWLLLENVPFMLQLARGQAMTYLTGKLEALGFSWAYRVVDAQSFGLPQRRQRVLLLASRSEDPRQILLSQDAAVPPRIDEAAPCGFYWTEGTRGLGWAVDAVPTLKGGSSIGIPSPPAIWQRHTDQSLALPDIRDAERLQGFDPDWTLPALVGTRARKGRRWKLLGNAVCVPVARWIGERLKMPLPYDDTADRPFSKGAGWPRAAWGRDGLSCSANVSMWPVSSEYQHLIDFLHFPLAPLSARATAGFLRRARQSSLRFAPGFLDAALAHLEKQVCRGKKSQEGTN